MEKNIKGTHGNSTKGGRGNNDIDTEKGKSGGINTSQKKNKVKYKDKEDNGNSRKDKRVHKNKKQQRYSERTRKGRKKGEPWKNAMRGTSVHER